MRHHFTWLATLFSLVFFLAACVPAAAPAAPAAAATPAATTAPAAPAAPAAGSDLLADIQARGILRVSTDPAYPPQSELAEGVAPPADTKCKGEERPANQFTGFDIDVAAELAKRLNVEPCFVTPDWTLIVGGSWAGRWDMSVGSVTITPERMKVLYFAQPYYTTPAAFFVHTDSKATTVADLSGKRIGVCSGCTYESYINGTLEIPGEKINYQVKGAEAVGYDTDTSALQDQALGDGVRLDGVLTALPTGLAFIKGDKPLKQLGDPVYFEYLAPAIDRNSELDPKSFLAKITELVQAMHSDGTLKSLSEKYYGSDLATPASSFDLSALEQ